MPFWRMPSSPASRPSPAILPQWHGAQFRRAGCTAARSHRPERHFVLLCLRIPLGKPPGLAPPIRLTVKFTYDSTADRTTEPLAAASPQDAVHTVAQALSDGTFCIALRPEGGRWSEADVEQLALSAIDNAALPCTVSTSHLLCPAEHSDRQFVALLYEPMLEEAEYTSCKSGTRRFPTLSRSNPRPNARRQSLRFFTAPFTMP